MSGLGVGETGGDKQREVGVLREIQEGDKGWLKTDSNSGG